MKLTKNEDWFVELYKVHNNGYNTKKAYFDSLEDAELFVSKCKGKFFAKPCSFKECSNYFGVRTRKLDKLLKYEKVLYDSETKRLSINEEYEDYD